MIEFETDSRKIKEGQIYVAIKGHTVDGHDFINQAILKGAKAVVVERDVDVNVPVIKVNNTQEYLTEQIVKNYSNQINDLNIIGVTGTNGKTTTCYLTYQMLNDLGVKTAYIGTIGFYCGDNKIELPNTTPDILSLYKLLLEAKEEGCTHVVMEVSSHALDQERIKGLKFVSAAFTNLTQDHLDYHKTMDNYLEAKLKIMDYIIPNGNMIVNADDPASKRFIKDGINTITLGYKENSNVTIKHAEYNPIQTNIDFSDDDDRHITNNLTSKFNIYNYMTAYTILRSLGVSFEDIERITKDIKAPTGRCEIIATNQGYAVVDYAHTPDAVEKIISSMEELKKNKIITLVGCGGDRDPIKRPIMGDIACRNSDYVIFTSDNPRTEDPLKILDDITHDLKYTNYEVIPDRTKAIRHGIELLEPEDILLVLGKGHENYQIIGHEKIHLDDHEIIRDWNKEHDNQKKRSLK
ncbi:MAG: UDP-N-acetylmuramoyl-L-alanyl-D-glutamate--2,6-diaminopimelate ligase [Bacilli bacterium]|nr:UDP-N-acetylmuramoyl-L-alanyl-D-glutamate--2,6-diaminopimelate ligase [Bacilli bacterium]